MRDKGGISRSFPTNPHNKPPYWISVGIGAAYVIRPSWSLFCYTLGQIRKSSFLCNSLIIFIKKKDKKNLLHLVINYYGLNNIIIPIHYPIP